MYTRNMPASITRKKRKLGRVVRRSISIPSATDARIRALAVHENRSTNQVIENLIESGLETKEKEKQRFFELAERLRKASDPAEVKQAKDALARMIFGS
jgi:predicted DNA-binding protein